eukprot:320663-Hanusia_phi.AAC.1
MAAGMAQVAVMATCVSFGLYTSLLLLADRLHASLVRFVCGSFFVSCLYGRLCMADPGYVRMAGGERGGDGPGDADTVHVEGEIEADTENPNFCDVCEQQKPRRARHCKWCNRQAFWRCLHLAKTSQVPQVCVPVGPSLQCHRKLRRNKELCFLRALLLSAQRLPNCITSLGFRSDARLNMIAGYHHCLCLLYHPQQIRSYMQTRLVQFVIPFLKRGSLSPGVKRRQWPYLGHHGMGSDLAVFLQYLSPLPRV